MDCSSFIGLANQSRPMRESRRIRHVVEAKATTRRFLGEIASG